MTQGKWLLPILPPPIDTRCYQIHLPDAPGYIRPFFGAVEELLKPWNWEGTDEEIAQVVEAYRLQIDAAYEDWQNEICGPGEDPACFAYLPYAPFIEWHPQPANPYTNPNYLPPGYLTPPFGVNAGAGPGYAPTDVFAQGAPLVSNIFDLLTQGFPQIRIYTYGPGQIELDLLASIFGGKAILTDYQPTILDFISTITDALVIDLFIDVTTLPTEDDLVQTQEWNFTSAAGVQNVLYVTFVPRVDPDSLIPLSFGGGIREVRLCGFADSGSFDLSMPIRDKPTDPGIIQQLQPDGVTWLDIIDVRQYAPDPVLSSIPIEGGNRIQWDTNADTIIDGSFDVLDGIDGREVEMQGDGDIIEWRLLDDPSWISLGSFKGMQGDPICAGETRYVFGARGSWRSLPMFTEEVIINADKFDGSDTLSLPFIATSNAVVQSIQTGGETEPDGARILFALQPATTNIWFNLGTKTMAELTAISGNTRQYYDGLTASAQWDRRLVAKYANGTVAENNATPTIYQFQTFATTGGNGDWSGDWSFNQTSGLAPVVLYDSIMLDLDNLSRSGGYASINDFRECINSLQLSMDNPPMTGNWGSGWQRQAWNASGDFGIQWNPGGVYRYLTDVQIVLSANANAGASITLSLYEDAVQVYQDTQDAGSEDIFNFDVSDDLIRVDDIRVLIEDEQSAVITEFAIIIDCEKFTP